MPNFRKKRKKVKNLKHFIFDEKKTVGRETAIIL